MANYIVYRHGSNGQNQPMTQVAVVWGGQAESRKDACERARKAGVSCWANQRLEARATSRCSQRDIDAANEANMASEIAGRVW